MLLNKGPDEGARQKVAIVTGSSSGIGYATSLMLARKGFYTYASARNIDKSASLQSIANAESLPLKLIQLDVTDDSSAKDALEKIVLERGRIDVLVNNAGYALFGAFEDLSLDEIKAQFETNFFGVIRVTQHVLPIMRKQGAGVIVNVSSINGLIAFPVISAYVSTKFAIEGLSESIAYELEPFGIKVILIEPGVIGSNFMKGSVLPKKALDPKSPYSELVQKVSVKTNSQHEDKNATQPQEVANTIIQAISTEKPEFRYVVGNDAVGLLEARKNMPYSEFQKMIIQNIKQ